MIKMAKTFAGIFVSLLALVSRRRTSPFSPECSTLAQPRKGKPQQARDRWIGQKVVTKYEPYLLVVEIKLPDAYKTIEGFTSLKNSMETESRLIAPDVGGWIESSTISAP